MVKQDEELWAWIRSVNELAEKFPDPVMGNEDCFPNDGRNRIEMVSARFRFMQASYPHIVIEAPSMKKKKKKTRRVAGDSSLQRISGVLQLKIQGGRLLLR